MTATEAPRRATETVDDAGREQLDEIADESRSAADRARVAVMGAFERVPDLFGTARKGASQVADHLPEAVGRARVGAQETATTLQTMSDPTLRLLAAGSIGLAVGLYLAGARRPFTLAAMVPAVIAGSALATRPAHASHPSR
jgi:hypothetical protein